MMSRMYISAPPLFRGAARRLVERLGLDGSETRRTLLKNNFYRFPARLLDISVLVLSGRGDCGGAETAGRVAERVAGNAGEALGNCPTYMAAAGPIESIARASMRDAGTSHAQTVAGAATKHAEAIGGAANKHAKAVDGAGTKHAKTVDGAGTKHAEAIGDAAHADGRIGSSGRRSRVTGPRRAGRLKALRELLRAVAALKDDVKQVKKDVKGLAVKVAAVNERSMRETVVGAKGKSYARPHTIDLSLIHI